VGDGDQSNGYGNEGGEQAMATMAMVMVTKRAMVMATRWWATKRPIATVARAMKMATKRAIALAARAMATKTERAKATDREGNGDGGKSDGNDNEEGNSKGSKSNCCGDEEGEGNDGGGKMDGSGNKEGNGKGGRWQGQEEVWRRQLWWRATKRAMARAATGNGYGKEGGGCSTVALMGAARRTRQLTLRLERGG
jgi:hypothetical protein